MTATGLASAQCSIKFENLSLGYGGKTVVASISGSIAEGALIALVGPNGAGKSTLLKALAGLLLPMSGKISSNAIAERRIAYVSQHSEIDRDFPMSVLDFVAMGLWKEIGWWRPVTRAHLVKARAALSRIGLDGAEKRRVGTLSGGQLRRAIFARATLQDASVMLLDEPFAGIDEVTAHDLFGLVRGWHGEGRTIVAALHDLDQVRAHFPEIILLARKIVGWGSSSEVLTEVNLATARQLLTSTGKADNGTTASDYHVAV